LSTRLGEQKPALLTDLSKVLLNTDSQLEVDYSAKQRRIHLLKGEAYFEVKHDVTRPFLVYAGRNIVRAVGTAFTVRLNKAGVEVIVTQGNVKLSSLEDGTATPAKDLPSSAIRVADVAAGQRAVISEQVESIQPIAPIDIERKLSWREGVLAFSGEPLEQVVAEVRRYTPVTIVISDPAIRNLRIGGYFKVGETDAMLQALETSFGIRINRVNDHLVYLAAK
jgi:transmembrane sensor